jgi:DNA-binding response OmpR family regulator
MTDRLVFPPELGLTPIEIPLASLLVQRERVSSSAAYDVLYAIKGKKPKFGTLKTHISNIRKKFAKLGLRVETVWGWGWKMPPPDREKLRKLISR